VSYELVLGSSSAGGSSVVGGVSPLDGGRQPGGLTGKPIMNPPERVEPLQILFRRQAHARSLAHSPSLSSAGGVEVGRGGWGKSILSGSPRNSSLVMPPTRIVTSSSPGQTPQALQSPKSPQAHRVEISPPDPSYL
jgi:hypothetical protein